MLLALIVVTVGAALIIAHTDRGRAMIARQVEAVLATTFPGGVKIGRIEGSVFGELVVRDLVINGPDKLPFATVAKVSAEVSILPFLSRTARLDRVEATGVVVTNPRSPVLLDDEPPGRWRVEIGRIGVTDARVVISASPQGPIEIAELSLFAALNVEPGGIVNLFTALRGHWTQRNVDIGGIATLRVADDITFPAIVLAAGGASIIVGGGAIEAPAGSVIVSAPAKSVARLVPGVVLPGDVQLSIAAATAGQGDASSTRARIRASLGEARLDGVFAGSQFAVAGRRLEFHGVLAATDVDLATVTQDKVTGHGTAVVAVAGSLEGVHGSIVAIGDVMSAPTARAIIAFGATPTTANALVIATGAGGLRVAGAGGIRMEPEGLALASTRVGVAVDDLDEASGGLVPVHGRIGLEAKVGGALDSVAVAGKLTATRIRAETFGAASVRGNFAGRLGAKPSGVASLIIDRVTNAGSAIGSAKLEATVRPDRRIAVVVNARPAAAPVTADVAAIITIGDVIDVALASHRIALPNATWAGTGGHVRIDDRAITITNFRTTSGESSVAANVTIGRLTSKVTAQLAAREVALAGLDPKLTGTVDANLAFERRGLAWTGGGQITAKGVAASSMMRPLDATVELNVAGRRVKVAAKVSNSEIGGARVALEVDGPVDLTDGDAWKRVTRADLHGVTIGFETLDLRPLTNDKVAGIFDGEIEIREGVADGKLRVRGIPTPVGPAQADIVMSLDDVGYIDLRGDASVGNVGTAKVDVRVALPDHPFSPAVWRALGINAIQSASITTSEIAVNPKLLNSFGLTIPYAGTVTTAVTIGTGGSTVDVAVDAKNVTGGVLVKSIDAHVGARVDGTETTAQLRLSTGKTTLAEVTEAKLPVSLDQWIADPKAQLGAALAATLTIPKLRAVTLLALIGRSDVTKGTLDGTITIGGTILAPTVQAKLALANVVVRPRLAGKPPPEVSALTLDASWDGKLAKASITAREAGGGLLNAQASSGLDLTTFRGRVAITNFDLTPLAAFLPGPLVGAQGILEADLSIRGVDATVGTTRGFVSLTKGRVPLTAVLGTLRDTTLRIDLTDNEIKLKVAGTIGAKGQTIALEAHADPRGVNTKLTAKLTKLTPIGYLQPQIDASITGTLHREKLFFTGKLDVTDGRVFIPEHRGNPLLDEEAPEDLIFVGEPVVAIKRGRIPERPFLVVAIAIDEARLEIPSFPPVLENTIATAVGNVQLSVGETIGLDGQITIARGQLTLFGHEYTVERAEAAFDGTLDPMFDVRLTHDFPEVTTFVRVAGRLSTIDSIKPELTSDPGTYSESQLFGFLVGGSPTQDENQGQALAAGAASAVAFGSLRGVFKRVAVVKEFDVIRCNPTVGSTEGSCTLGKWLTDDLFLSGVGRFTDRLDENNYEGRFQYFLRHDLTLEGVGGDHAQGLDLLLRRRF